MFTGIIDHNGEIIKITKKRNKDISIFVLTRFKPKDIKLGSSICCNGVCLTVCKIKKLKNKLELSFDVSNETINCTNFSKLKIGSKINLEKSLRMGDEISGHFVFGHVDEVSKLLTIKRIKGSHQLKFSKSKKLSKYIAKKGSIAVDGVSLTINSSDSKSFSVNIVPYTWEHTNFNKLKVNSLINVEVDMLARYVSQNLK
ncbi:MAG: riboflavin synthase [Candidatus Pelagibacterales bacterium]|jgi:riboflavin synthase|tara:strand:+ start:35 stop:634 length:600 start_codon:yes stop_codon:yes gene_type:complete